MAEASFSAASASSIICWETSFSASIELVASIALRKASAASWETHVPSVDTSEPSAETTTPAKAALAEAMPASSAERSTAADPLSLAESRSTTSFNAGLPASGWISALSGTAYSLDPVKV